jgi:hypothetical protein
MEELTNLEKSLQNLPERSLTDEKIESIWADMQAKSHKASRWGILANVLLLSSLVVLIFVGYTQIPILQNNERETVEIKLQSKTQAMGAGNNSLFVLRADGTEQELSASDYQIEGDTLKINLPKGTYKIVLASDKYKPYIATATIN